MFTNVADLLRHEERMLSRLNNARAGNDGQAAIPEPYISDLK